MNIGKNQCGVLQILRSTRGKWHSTREIAHKLYGDLNYTENENMYRISMVKTRKALLGLLGKGIIERDRGRVKTIRNGNSGEFVSWDWKDIWRLIKERKR